MTSHDRDYHRTRSREELDRGRSAASMCARRAHLELARLHAERMESGYDHLGRDPSGLAQAQAAHSGASIPVSQREP